MDTLEKVAEEVRVCTLCHLAESRLKRSPLKGNIVSVKPNNSPIQIALYIFLVVVALNFFPGRIDSLLSDDGMSANPLDIYRQFDPKVTESFQNLQDLALSEGALSQKVKLLIATAIDVEHGALQGAMALAQRATRLGATREEIVEALKVAYYVGGNRALFTSALLLQNLFK